MTEQELKPLIVQLYTEMLTGFDAGAQDSFDEDAVAEGAELLANEFILGIKEADELDELLSLSPEEIRELFNKKKVISANNCSGPKKLALTRLYPFCFRKVIAELGFVFNAWEICEACFSG